MAITTVTIDDDLRFQLKQLALDRHTSFKAILNEALKKYLQTKVNEKGKK